MRPRSASTGLLLTILFLALASHLGCSTEAIERAKQKRTIATMRNLGTVLMERSETWRRPTAENTADPKLMAERAKNPRVIRIDTARLQQWLPGVDLAELTRDAWGHGIEVWLEDHGETRRLMIRSLGRDGEAESEVPESEWASSPASFPSAEAERDIIWVDGHFLTWPG